MLRLRPLPRPGTDRRGQPRPGPAALAPAAGAGPRRLRAFVDRDVRPRRAARVRNAQLEASWHRDAAQRPPRLRFHARQCGHGLRVGQCGEVQLRSQPVRPRARQGVCNRDFRVVDRGRVPMQAPMHLLGRDEHVGAATAGDGSPAAIRLLHHEGRVRQGGGSDGTGRAHRVRARLQKGRPQLAAHGLRQRRRQQLPGLLTLRGVRGAARRPGRAAALHAPWGRCRAQVLAAQAVDFVCGLHSPNPVRRVLRRILAHPFRRGARL
mmetsp:Transcript_52211/g.158626  ORF Transcript_52211/g.158626 Transcript_52211/m.158626 type:complete len:265 (+) Transcript_52211:731-1525(+)